MTREQCLFYVAQLDDGAGDGGRGDGGGGGISGPSLGGAWDGVDAVLGEAAGMLSKGLGGELTAEALSERCEQEPRPQKTDHGRAWACFLTEPPILVGHEMSLEIGEVGVAGLTGFDFTGEQSDLLLADARKHWRSWCTTSSFEEVDTERDKDAYRCALPGGSQLVLARILQDPADLSSDLWQVSLMVMGPG